MPLKLRPCCTIQMCLLLLLLLLRYGLHSFRWIHIVALADPYFLSYVSTSFESLTFSHDIMPTIMCVCYADFQWRHQKSCSVTAMTVPSVGRRWNRLASCHADIYSTSKAVFYIIETCFGFVKINMPLDEICHVSIQLMDSTLIYILMHISVWCTNCMFTKCQVGRECSTESKWVTKDYPFYGLFRTTW